MEYRVRNICDGDSHNSIYHMQRYGTYKRTTTTTTKTTTTTITIIIIYKYKKMIGYEVLQVW